MFLEELVLCSRIAICLPANKEKQVKGRHMLWLCICLSKWSLATVSDSNIVSTHLAMIIRYDQQIIAFSLQLFFFSPTANRMLSTITPLKVFSYHFDLASFHSFLRLLTEITHLKELKEEKAVGREKKRKPIWRPLHNPCCTIRAALTAFTLI